MSNFFNPWPSIESLHRVKTSALTYEKECNLRVAPIGYRAKIKLHGTNAGVTISSDGRVTPQSRSGIISSGTDNTGFAAWVETNSKKWSKLAKKNTTLIVFGEWCGPGIQDKVAISNIPSKIFAVFAIQTGRSNYQQAAMIIDPKRIAHMLNYTSLTENDGLFVLPWHGGELVVDFWAENLSETVDTINNMVRKVEIEDPWVKNTFNASGIGEGLVFYPDSVTYLNGVMLKTTLQEYIFKAKGEKHRVIKTKNAADIDPEIAQSLDEFIDQVSTPARIEQAVSEGAKGIFNKKLVGSVVAWFNKDVRKDINNGEIIMPKGIEWRTVSGKLTTKIKNWYLQKVEKIND